MDTEPLTCTECGARFEFAEEERQRFQARGFMPPKRCRACRAAKRGRQAEGARGGAAQPPSPGPAAEPAPVQQPAPAPRPPRPPAQMHPAVCSVCGAATEVPFLPDGVRPVYCLACLKQRTR